MNLVGIARLGQDARINYTADGKPVVNMSLAFNWGLKGPDGKRLSQWVECAYWSDRAVKAQPYLTKGTQLYVMLEDPHIEEYTKRDGTGGFKLVARVASIEFAGSVEKREQGTKPAMEQQTPRDKAMKGIMDMKNDMPDDSDGIPF